MKRILASLLAVCLLWGGCFAFATEGEGNPAELLQDLGVIDTEWELEDEVQNWSHLLDENADWTVESGEMPPSLVREMEAYVEYKSYYYSFTVDDAVMTWYKSAYAEEFAAMDWDAYIAEEWPWYESLEEMAAAWEQTEEQVIDELLMEYLQEDFLPALVKQQQYAAKKLKLGGVPGEYGIMTMEGYLPFSQPLTAEAGVLYAPAEELAAFLGAELTGDDEYAAVRTVAEAAGYTVYWDSEYETAVLIDYGALTAELDENLTIMNRAWKRQLEQLSKGVSGTATVELTLFDSISGDDVMKGSIAYDATLTEDGMSMGLKLDAIEYMTLVDWYLNKLKQQNGFFADLYNAEYYEEQAKNLAAARNALALLAESEMRFDVSFAEETITVEFPALEKIMEVLVPVTGMTAEEMMEDMGDMVIPVPGLGSISLDGSYGNLMAQAMETQYATNYQRYTAGWYYAPTQPVDYPAEIAQMTGAVVGIMGDNRFTQSGGKDMLTITMADFNELFELDDLSLLGYYSISLEEYFPVFEMTMSVDSKGDMTSAVDIQMNLNQMGKPDNIDILMTGKSVSGPRSGESTMELHIKNGFKLVVKEKVTVG